MSDFQDAAPAGGNTGFGDEWHRLAREDGNGQASAPLDADDDRHEIDQGEAEPDGQDGNAVPPSEAAPALEPAPDQETANDIWADAPEALRQAFEAERVAREKAENAVRSNNGRLSKAERDTAALRAQLLAGSQPAPQAKPAAAAEDPAALRSKLVGDYDEVVSPIADEVLQLRQTVADLVTRDASAQAQREAQNQLALAEFLQAEETRLVEAHPDWAEVVLEPEFVSWATGSPQFIRDGINRNANGIVDAKESAAIIDLYKADTGRVPLDDPNAAKRRRQLEGARAVPARSPGVTPAGSPNDFDAEWKRLAAADKAQAKR